MFINNSLNFHIREDLMSSQDDFEAIFIEIQRANASNLIVGNVYRAPGTCLNFHKCFDSCLEKVTSEGKLCYIMGDFNLNLLNCEGHQPTDLFVNTFYSYGFLPLITKPTRITPHTATLIDNILTNSDLDITAGLLYSYISDHYPLFQLTASCFKNSVPLQKTFVTRDINSNSLHSFSCDLNSVDWQEVYEAQDVDSAYNSFLSIFTSRYNHFPLITKITGKSQKINHGSPSL